MDCRHQAGNDNEAVVIVRETELPRFLGRSIWAPDVPRHGFDGLEPTIACAKLLYRLSYVTHQTQRSFSDEFRVRINRHAQAEARPRLLVLRYPQHRLLVQLPRPVAARRSGTFDRSARTGWPR